MDRHLTKNELANTRGFINLLLSERSGKVVPVKIVASSIPSADGFNLITWASALYEGSDKRNPIVRLFPAVYPVEDVGPRFRERKNYLYGPAERDCSLVRGENGIYRMSPREVVGGVSGIYPDSLDYSVYAQRLTQEEFF